MKKLITLIIFIFISNLSFSQNPIRKSGNFYELATLWKKDSVSVKKLINNFNLDITKLETVRFFKDFELSKKLQDEYSYTSYLYILDKETNLVTMNSYTYEGVKPKLNKYVMIVCFDNDSTKKTISIKVF